MDYVKLGKILQEARTTLRLKQSDVSKELNCTSSNVSSWERGKSKIDIDSLVELCKIYRLNCVEVLQSTVDTNTLNVDNDEARKRLINNYDLMNENARHTLVEYSDFMVSKRENLKDDYSCDKMNA